MKRSEFLVDCAAHLSRQGFVPSFDGRRNVEPFTRQLGFVRPSAHAQAFEEVRLIPLQESVGVCLRLTIVPTGNRWRGMFLEVPMTKSLSAPVVRFQTTDDLRQSLDLIESIPHVFSSVAPNETFSFLGRTEVARKCSRDYMQRVGGCVGTNVSALLSELQMSLSQEQHFLSRSMLQYGLVNIPCSTDAEEERAINCYKAATTLIVGGSMEDVFLPFSTATSPYENQDLAWCIQVVASRLYSPSLWFGN